MGGERRQQLVRLYEDSKGSGVCGNGDTDRGCGARLDWYQTLNLKSMPMNAGAVPLRSELEASTRRVIVFFDAADSHLITCPKRAEFKK